MAKRTAKRIDSRLAKREGGKSQAKMGDVREIRAKLETMIAEEIARGHMRRRFTEVMAGDISYSKSLIGMRSRIKKKAQKMLNQMRKEKRK